LSERSAMRVFKGYMKITSRNIGTMLMYFIIFFTMAVFMQKTYTSEELDNFAAVKNKVAIVDEDKGNLARLLKEYLKDVHHVKEYSHDEELLQEEMYYGNIEYIVWIPKDFEQKLISGEAAVKETARPGTYSGAYVEQQISGFLNHLRTYKAAGFSDEEIEKAIQEREKSIVKLADPNGNGGAASMHSYLFQFLPYIMIAALSYVLSFILAAFNNKDVKNRMRASAISGRREALESFLAFAVIGLGFWCMCMLFTAILYGKEFTGDVLLPYYLMNSLALLVVALSISFLVGNTVKDKVAINGVVNVLSLGMSFLCGAFIPLSMLSVEVKKVAVFLPVYWYEKINDLLSVSGRLSDSMKITIWKGLGIQLLFAAACLGVGLAVTKLKRQE